MDGSAAAANADGSLRQRVGPATSRVEDLQRLMHALGWSSRRWQGWCPVAHCSRFSGLLSHPWILFALTPALPTPRRHWRLARRERRCRRLRTSGRALLLHRSTRRRGEASSSHPRSELTGPQWLVGGGAVGSPPIWSHGCLLIGAARVSVLRSGSGGLCTLLAYALVDVCDAASIAAVIAADTSENDEDACFLHAGQHRIMMRCCAMWPLSSR